MNNWKTISRIASISGIIFAVFAAFTAFTTYELIAVQYSIVPAAFTQFSILASMLPYLLFAVLSFAFAGVTSRAAKEKIQEPMQPEHIEQQMAEEINP